MQELSSEGASQLPVDEVLHALKGHPDQGLSEQEVARRTHMFGPNEFGEEEQEPLWRKYLEQFKEPLILLLLGSAAVSILMGQYDDAVSITLAIVIVVTVAFVQEYRSEKSLEELTKLIPPRCHVLRGGHVHDILARDLVPGDIVAFSIGDRIPADLRLIEAVDVEIDESSLTGESEPSTKHTKAIADGSQRQLAGRHNMAFLGTLVRAGRGRGVVTTTAEKSEFGLIFRMMKEVEDPRTPLQHRMDQLGKQLSVFSFAVIGVILLVGLLQGRDLVKMFAIAVSLAVAAIPEGLPIVVTVTLALGVMRMSKKNAIVRKLPAVEALGSATVVCTDKTGTLTENNLTITQLYVHHNETFAEVTRPSYINSGCVVVRGAVADPVSHPAIARLFTTGSLCNNAIVRDGKILGNPLEGALLLAMHKFGLDDVRDKHTRLSEQPFSSAAKVMSVVCAGPAATPLIHLKGMLEAVLPQCSTFFAPDKPTPLTDKDRADIAAVATKMARTGLRVLALACGQEAGQLSFLGLVGAIDPPRAGVCDSIAALQQAGVMVVMITGDMMETAEAIGESLGLFDRRVHRSLDGSTLDTMSPAALAAAVHTVRIFYRTAPKHKLDIIRAFKAAGHIVAMTGDGVNDALALKQADIGVAMGRSGTDVAKEASDMVLVDDNFNTIMSAIEEGKSIAHNIRNFLRFQLSTSVAALTLITISTVAGFPAPLNAMQILWINILMDGPPAQSLGVEPVDPDVMLVPPRNAKESMITKHLISCVVATASLIVAGTLYVFWRETTADGLITARDTTMTFTTFVCFDMFNALSCRSQTKSIFTIGLTSNRAFLWAVGGSLLGQLGVIYFPPLQRVFQTEALALTDLVFILLLTSSVFILDETRKFLSRNPRAIASSRHTEAV
eukprot:m.63464 g.63464  ORF g.63464 m.63464 type:complete len:898 (+) comp12469_c2_seq1:249-2942(+)